MTILGITLITLVTGLASMGIHGLIQRWVDHRRLRNLNDVAAAVYTNFGVLFSLILGILIGQGEERRGDISSAAVHEAAILMDLVNVAQAYDDEVGRAVHTAAIGYASAVIDEEWPLLAEHQGGRIKRAPLEQLWRISKAIDPNGPRGQALYDTTVSMLENLAEARYERISVANDNLSDLLRFVLWVGAAFTIAFLWFFGAENQKVQLLLTGIVTSMLSLVLILVLSMNNPLAGELGVRPEPFVKLLRDLSSAS
ncbi:MULTISPECIES: bestrophin-like domain [Methylococcus]|jgi:hypothetical protein|nr:DUF4239 domain-containing protein [Methylococcus capsulatus]QXP88488.1 DUF4239 domain-containing protein [Methylococcus capsulatus]QXP90155.1 DUF4239 domain-containing protein [Methylococcus capsulatus]QXP94496.1 DUF4239 domain-containing protein [Methylococcus capsulatus]UQN13537.1 DUF4239 domain-containing protein [Methylococcus capsulatus]